MSNATRKILSRGLFLVLSSQFSVLSATLGVAQLEVTLLLGQDI